MAIRDAPAADPPRRGSPSTTTPERVAGARARLAPRHAAVAVAMTLLILTSTAVPVAAQARRDALEDADRGTLLAMVEPFLPDEVRSSIDDAAPANATGSGDAASDPGDEKAETRPVCDPETSDCTDCKGGGCGDADPAGKNVQARPICDPRTGDCTDCRGSDCVPDPCEVVPCDPDPADLTDGLEIYEWGGDVCENGDCVPPLCEVVPCDVDPCDHVDCDPDPPCQKDVEQCTDRDVEARAPISPDRCTQRDCTPAILELTDQIRWTTSYPKTTLTVDDGYTLTGGVHNELDVPILLTVEPHVDSPSVCSIQGFSSSSAKPTPRQHEYLLLGNGTEDAVNPADAGTGHLDGVNVQLLDDLGVQVLNGDSISFSIDILTGDVTGTCEVTLRAFVQVVGANRVYVGEQSMATEHDEPLPSERKLGEITAHCQTNTVEATERPADPLEVEAGTVQVSADLVYEKGCPDSEEKGAILIQYRHVNSTQPDEWTNVTSVERADPGTATALNQSVNMSKTGDYLFKVTGVYWDDLWDWECRIALAIIIGSAIATGGSTGWVALASAIATILSAGAAGAFGVCQEHIEDTAPYTVQVTAEDSDSRQVPNVEDLLGDVHMS